MNHLKLDASSEKAVKTVCLKFLPIILVQTKHTEKWFYDRRQFFSNSENVLDLFEVSLEVEEQQQEDRSVKKKGLEKPKRQVGSGRPKGSFKLKDPAILRAVEEYMTLAGCGAHSRRREDIAKSGVTWSGDLYKSIKNTFFSKANNKGPGKSSVRRLGVAPHKSRKTAF